MSQNAELTLVLVKPDGLQRGLAGSIMSRLENRGLKLVASKLIHMDESLAKAHYMAHKDKPFFSGLVEFITSSPVLAMVWQGKDAVRVVRNSMGATNPTEAEPGTIRGDMAIDIGLNLVHGSDSTDTARKEIELFFSKTDILEYTRDIDRWIIES